MRAIIMRKEIKHVPNCRGSVTLVAATVLLPILFFLLTISLDITQLYSDRAVVQRLLDEAALQGYRYLPYSEQARKSISGYLKQLNSLPGEIEMMIERDSVEIVYNGTAPFTFATFAGIKAGIPYQLSARVKGTILHAALAIDTSALFAPESGEEPWGNDGLWPAARLFTHFEPFGDQISPREMTQMCFNPLFSGLKHSALRVFDYLSSFSKNSLGVVVFPGTLGPIDILKDTRRPGIALSHPSIGYFNVANDPRAKNSYCLALIEEEPLGSPYLIPGPLGAENGTVDFGERFTDPTTYLVSETSLADITVREALWTRAVKSGTVSTSIVLSLLTEMLSVAGELNGFEKQNRLAEKPTKVGVVISAGLPQENGEKFPSHVVKEALKKSVQQFWRGLGGEENGPSTLMRKGVIYFLILAAPGNPTSRSSIDELQQFFNQILNEQQMAAYFSVRISFSENPDDLAAGIVRSLVLENNTAVVDE